MPFSDGAGDAGRRTGGDKEVVMMPWERGLSNCEVRNGMAVPVSGEAVHVRPEGRKRCFIGTVTSLADGFEP